jgi:hypothetical protein
MLKSSFKSYFSYLRGLYKFHRLQVPYGTKKGTFYAVSHGVGLGGYQNILDSSYKITDSLDSSYIFDSSFKKYCSYLRSSYKFYHLQVSNGT